ncbi:hypothetical protein AX289_17505 [Methylorubrum populi]|nr:hypothetical protein AX289_17505 [Methylorubrum populi]
MPTNRIEIDGELYGWAAKHASLPNGRRTAVDVFWLMDRDPDRSVDIGRLTPWNGGAGWTVHPRLGGRQRAGRASMGYARTRENGIRKLVQLGRTEHCLTAFEKVDLRIVRDGPEGTIIDDSRDLVPLPKAA